MKSVLLSTTEAEYMALSEVVKELKFIVQLLHSQQFLASWNANHQELG